MDLKVSTPLINLITPFLKQTLCNRGYAYINFINPMYILDFYLEFQGLKWNERFRDCFSPKVSKLILFAIDVDGFMIFISQQINQMCFVSHRNALCSTQTSKEKRATSLNWKTRTSWRSLRRASSLLYLRPSHPMSKRSSILSHTITLSSSMDPS